MKNYLFLTSLLLVIKLNATPIPESPSQEWSNWWMQQSDNQCVKEMLESGLTSVFTYEMLCKVNDPHKAQCIRSIRNSHLRTTPHIYEKMCKNATQDTINCLDAANTARVGGLDYSLCLDSNYFTGRCITSVVNAGFKAPIVFEQLCRNVTPEKIMCIDTVDTIGITMSYEYSDLCYRADNARIECLTKVYDYGFRKFGTFKYLCLSATSDTVKCYDTVKKQGYTNSNSYKLFCEDANHNTTNCVSVVGAIDFETPGLTISNLCLQANDYTASCVETIHEIGIGKNYDSLYSRLCENSSEEKVQCYRNLHSAGVTESSTYEILCK